MLQISKHDPVHTDYYVHTVFEMVSELTSCLQERSQMRYNTEFKGEQVNHT